MKFKEQVFLKATANICFFILINDRKVIKVNSYCYKKQHFLITTEVFLCLIQGLVKNFF